MVGRAWAGAVGQALQGLHHCPNGQGLAELGCTPVGLSAQALTATCLYQKTSLAPFRSPGENGTGHCKPGKNGHDGESAGRLGRQRSSGRLPPACASAPAGRLHLLQALTRYNGPN